MEFSEDAVVEGIAASEARIAFLNMDLIVQAHPLLKSWRLISSETRGNLVVSHIELIDKIMGFDVAYQAAMTFDPIDPIGDIQFESEAALSIKVSHTYSFRDSESAAIVNDRVSVQYGWVSFALKFFVNSTVRSATRKVLDNMRGIIQEKCALAADTSTHKTSRVT
jgi:hypothetical protein